MTITMNWAIFWLGNAFAFVLGVYGHKYASDDTKDLEREIDLLNLEVLAQSDEVYRLQRLAVSYGAPRSEAGLWIR